MRSSFLEKGSLEALNDGGGMHKELKAVFIRHVAFEGPGILSRILDSTGFSQTMVDACDGGLSRQDPGDLLVVLGGPIGAYDERDYPFLVDEMKLIERSLKKGVPVIGICLGSQLAARVLGARVYPGKAKEIGWNEVSLTQEGRLSPLGCDGGVAGVKVLHWHGDTFDLPANAERLAETPVTSNQAFSMGKSLLALQFHLEVTARDLERWFVGHSFEISKTEGVTVGDLRKQTALYAEECEKAGEAVFRKFLMLAGFGEK
jgi:GMP synthase (glutamine-hydrolysing)